MNGLDQWLLEALLWVLIASIWVWSFRRFGQTSDLGRQWLLGAFLWGVVAWIWAWSFRLFAKASAAAPLKRLDTDSLFTALFGASSIALFFLSLIVATLAVFGWQSVKDHIEERVAKAVKERSKEVDEAIEARSRRVDEAFREKTQALENELRGRVATILGYTIGEMSLQPGTFKVRDRDRLSEAVGQCKAGYRYLQKIGGAAEFLGLNNLVFYTCVLEDGMPKENEEGMLALARLLLDAGQKQGSNMLKLTACRVLLEYGAPPQEKERARSILRTILDRRSPASAREKKEAKFYLAKYPEQSASVTIPEAESSASPERLE